MKNKVDLKSCKVCGDKALGYNFNAVTCESCKAFFRRNALIQKDFKCPFTNQCKITAVTRRFCQKCRLDKCFAVGMCKDLIMTEEDKAIKRCKIEENRAKKRHIVTSKGLSKRVKKEASEADAQDGELYSSYTTDSDSKDTSYSDGYQLNNANMLSGNIIISAETNREVNDNSITSSNDPLVTSSEDSFSFQQGYSNANVDLNSQVEDGLINNLIEKQIMMNHNERVLDTDVSGSISHVNKSSHFESKPLDVTQDVIRDIQSIRTPKSTQEQNPIDSILTEAIKLEYEAYPSLAQNNSHSRELNEAERAKLNELITANKALLTPVEDELSSIALGLDTKINIPGGRHQGTNPALLDVINLTAVAIRRVIKLAKKINSFKNMCQEDQVALLKGGCTEIMMIISAMKYDPTKNMWKVPSIQESLNVNANVLKLARGNVYYELERFNKTFDPKWRSDENIILILCAIVLFTPDRPRVIHQDVIKLEQNSYYYLLRRYLESIYVGCEAKSAFLKLIQKIMELRKVNEEIINVLLDVNPSQVEPLLIEIFDLK